MVGFVGERARKKRRNTLIFLSILLIVILYFFINPRIQLNENIPTDDFLPKENEIIEPNLNSTIEELELKIFDKEQKIIFTISNYLNINQSDFVIILFKSSDIEL